MDIREDILKKRYYLKNEEGVAVEDWDGLCKRVAKALSENEEQYEKFYDVMHQCLFLPNTPALINAGREKFSLSACYVIPVEDSMEGIYEAVKHTALIHKSGGGTGFSFSRLRPAGDIVATTKGVASGPCSFIRVFDTATEVTKQGGARRGANMGILRVDHPDIMDFIELKKEEGRISNFNLSIGITDDFISSLKEDRDFNLVFKGKTKKTLKAKEIWNAIVEGAWRNGEPGVVFLDTINRFNTTPHIGEIEATNPCFHGNTLVDTPLGLIPIKELVDMEVPVYTWDGEKVNISIAGMFRKTREKAEIWKLTLDDGGEVLATPDHKFLLRNGQSVKLKELKLGDSLIPLYRYKANSKGYTKISLNNGESKLEHILVAEWKYGRKLKDNESVHHIDGETSNNDPHNLVVIPKDVHASLHKTGYLNPMYRVWDERNPLFRRSSVGENNGRFRKDLDNNQIKELRKLGLSYKEIARRLGCSKYTVMKRLGWARPKSRELSLENHKVVKVEPWGYDDVYNCNVADTHIFAIAYTKPDGTTGGLLVRNCGEQPLLPFEACVLGSINLSKMISNVEIDWKKLGNVVRVAVRFLDNVIDVQYYPVPEIEKMHKGNRKIGLGVMGWADMLIKLGIPYNSDEALKLAEKVMGFITDTSIDESARLAEEKEVFPNWEGSVWHQKGIKVRNATTTTIAPTGSISIIAGCSSGIEPVFDFVTIQKRPVGEHKVVYPLYEEWLKNNGDKSLPEYFVTAREIPYEWHIRMQAAFQEHTHNAVSKTINLQKSASKEDISEAFLMAYNLGLRGITVYRDGSRQEQVISSASGYTKTFGDDIQHVLDAKRICVDTSEGKVYINVSLSPEKNPLEVFITTPVESEHSEVYESFARIFSVALRNGVPVKKMLSQLEKANQKYGSIASIPAAIIRAFRMIGINSHKESCPDCGGVLVLEEGCVKCLTCGYTKC